MKKKLVKRGKRRQQFRRGKQYRNALTIKKKKSEGREIVKVPIDYDESSKAVTVKGYSTRVAAMFDGLI